jgi:hypothetical protein
MSAPSDDVVGHTLHDRDSRPVGKITAVYRYPADLEAPAGVAVVTRGILRKSHLVDLESAEVGDQAVKVPHGRHSISSAPNFPPLMGDTLSQSNAVKVRDHYWGPAQPA